MRSTVGVAQLVRVPDCDSGCRGFESHHPPQFRYNIGLSFRSSRQWFFGCARRDLVFESVGPLAQLVEQETLNLLVLGSSPRRPTTFFPGESFDPRANVAELVDALDLGSSGATRESSSLSFRTSSQNENRSYI